MLWQSNSYIFSFLQKYLDTFLEKNYLDTTYKNYML